MARIPNFLTMIEDYRCINLSACAKQLKPAIDLATSDQKRSFEYVLDIFPGLYCQRITPAGSQPRMTVSKPVLIVRFATGLPQHRTDTLDPLTMMDGGTSVPLHASLQSHHLINTGSRVMKGNQTPAPKASHSGGTGDAHRRTANNSQKIENPQKRPQSSRYHEEVRNSCEGRRESQQLQPPHPELQNEGFFGGVLKRLWDESLNGRA